MINKLHEIPTFSLFNNYEIIRKMKFKINEIIDAINSPAPAPSGSGINYSFEEQKIGTAFGKDLYSKTYILSVADDFTDNSYTFPDDVDFIVNAYIRWSRDTIDMGENSNGAVHQYYNEPVTNSNKVIIKTFNGHTEEGSPFESGGIILDTGGTTASDFVSLLITIEYTKPDNA